LLFKCRVGDRESYGHANRPSIRHQHTSSSGRSVLESKTNIINVRGAQDHIVHTAAGFFKQTIHFLLLSATTSIQDTITGNRDKKAIGHMPPCNFQYLYVHEERCQSIGEGESYMYIPIDLLIKRS